MGLPRVAVPEYSLKLPSSGKEIKYRPFLVKEEKLLLLAMESEDEHQIINATQNVIKNCVYGDINVQEMPIFDMEYIFLWLRGRSKGEEIDLTYQCTACEADIPVKINIEDIKVKKEQNHTTKIELTEDLGVVMKYPNMSMQLNKDNDDNQVEQLFSTILNCIDYIYDKTNTYSHKDHTKAEMTEFIESLPDDSFQKISEFFETAPKLKHEIKIHCTNKKGKKTCGHKEDKVLEGLQSFFV